MSKKDKFKLFIYLFLFIFFFFFLLLLFFIYFFLFIRCNFITSNRIIFAPEADIHVHNQNTESTGGRLSLKVGRKNGPERGLKTITLNLNYL